MLRPLIMLLLAAAATPPDAAGRTEVIDRAALARLRGNEGVSLQWIDWDGTHRGLLHVRQPGALVHIDGEQRAAGQPGVLTIDGDVLRIAAGDSTSAGDWGSALADVTKKALDSLVEARERRAAGGLLKLRSEVGRSIRPG